MGVLLYLNTDTSYMELENIQELKITQAFNEHGILTLTALIQEDTKTKYATEIKPYEMVEVVVGEEGNYKTIFKGIVKNIEIHQIKKTYYLFVTAATGSYKMDLEIRSRSFQDKGITYKQMLEIA